MAASDSKQADISESKAADIAGKDKTKTFEFKCKYYASSNAVFTALTDPRDVMRFTGAPATGEAKEGEAWSWMDGAIHGTYEVLLPGEAIVTSWRFKDWAVGVASTVTITLTPSGADACVLKLKQTNIPETDGHGNGNVETTVTNGWKGFIFAAIKARLGFGMEEL